MEQKIVKLEITNSVNENTEIIWVFFKTIENKEEWVQKKKSEQHKWNYETSGAYSVRYYYFEEFSPSDLLDLDVSELKGMKLKDFIKLTKEL